MPFRPHYSAQESFQRPCTSEDNVKGDLYLADEKQEEEAEDTREMEEESAGRSAEKVPGAGDDDGSAAPLPERVMDIVDMRFLSFLVEYIIGLCACVM